MDIIIPILLLAKKDKTYFGGQLEIRVFICLFWIFVCFCFPLQCSLTVNSQRLLHNRTLAYNIATLTYSTLKKLKNKAVVSKAMYPFQKLRKITKELTWC